MPITDNEWESGKEWTEVERAVAEFLSAVSPRAYAVAELDELLVEGGSVDPPADEWDDDGPDPVRVAPMDVTERAVRTAVTNLRDAEFLESKRVDTADGVVTYYRRSELNVFG
ncbi:hypothetical protein [Halobellus salinus]|nr:hypothetical protein [Halobellus salinus]SMP30350.1 hypothetical protein SAMN06265347_11621 [Halobellus salinus]